MRFFRKSLIGLFMWVVTLGFLVVAAGMVNMAVQDKIARPFRAPVQKERVFAVNVKMAKSQTITPVLQAFGEVQSARTLDLRFARGGQVAELSPQFIEGGQITKGELLLRLDGAALQSVLARANADVLDAKNEVSDAGRAMLLAQDEVNAAKLQADLRQKALGRQKDLNGRGVGTSAAVEAAELAASAADQAVLSRRSSLDQSAARKGQAKTKVQRAKLSLQDAARQLEEGSLRAEFAGTLSGVNLVQGGLVSANEKLGNLLDPTKLEVAFRLSTEQYLRLLDPAGRLIASPTQVVLDVYGTEFTSSAVLSRDSGSVAQGLSGRLVFATVLDPTGLQPGDFVKVRVNEPELDSVFRLPAGAVDAQGTLLVLGDEDRLEALKVEVVRLQGDEVLVTAANLNGREVVAQRTKVIGAGIKVKPLRASDAGMGKELLLGSKTVELTDQRRQKLIAFVEGNAYMPKDAKERILSQLKEPQVSRKVVERLESRMGG
jgi:hypothetical protein